MLPSYNAVLQEQQQEQQQQQQQQQGEGSSQGSSFHSSYQGLHHQTGLGHPVEHNQTQSAAPNMAQVNSVFLRSPAGALLLASCMLGLINGICGAIPTWSLVSGGAFCVFSGLLHFSGASFLFFAYLYNFIGGMPWYTRPLAIYYYIICGGVSILAFVYSASIGALHSAAVASAVFTFLAMAVDIVLAVLSFLALKMGPELGQYSSTNEQQEA